MISGMGYSVLAYLTRRFATMYMMAGRETERERSACRIVTLTLISYLIRCRCHSALGWLGDVMMVPRAVVGGGQGDHKS